MTSPEAHGIALADKPAGSALNSDALEGASRSSGPESGSPALPTARRWAPPARSRIVSATILLSVIVASGCVAYAWQLPPFGGAYEQTDDAYVRGQTTVISPQVSGYVSEVRVSDFQDVGANQVLVRIEDSPYSTRVAQSRANVLTQQANLDNSSRAERSKTANLLAQDAAIANAESQLLKAQTDLGRTEALIAHGWATASVRDQQTAAVRAADAQLREARASRAIGTQDVQAVIVGRRGLTANVDAAAAQVRLAQLDLQHTIIHAPQPGQLSEVAVRPGQYVTSGTQLMYLIPKERWVIANFREAQTRNMQVGQKAWFTVDALGGTKFEGRLERLAPAAGSEFAVLRPDNATGNFVKVAQRIAARIRIDPNQPMAARLRPGMSVVAWIRTEAPRAR